MQVQEAWAVWASAVAHGASGIDHQLLKGAVGALFQPRAAAELWQAVTDGEGSTLALAVTLKAALQQLLRDLELAGSSPQLLSGAQATVRTLELAKILILWYEQPGESETHDWCGEQWRSVVDFVLGWAPALIEACMDQLPVGQTVQPCSDILPQDLDSCSAEEAVKHAASSCLDLATSFLDGGAVDWLRPSPLLQALSAWVRVAERVGKHFEPVENNQSQPGLFEVRHLLRLLVSALTCHGEEGQFTQYRGLVARSLAQDTGLLLATARLSMFAASRGFPEENGEACFSLTFPALQILACSELQPGIVEACIYDPELPTWLLPSINEAAKFLISGWEAAGFNSGAIVGKSSSGVGSSGSSKHDTITAGTGDGNSAGLNGPRLGFAVQTAGVFWRYCDLLGRLQQQLVVKGRDQHAKVLQWACYVPLRAVHSVLSEVLAALLACSTAEASLNSAQTAWQPGSQPEQQLLWKLAVACRGALDNLMSVLTADWVDNKPAGHPEPRLASKQRTSDKLVDMRAVLEAGVFYLSAGMHPLWHSLWAGMYAVLQQGMVPQARHWVLPDSQLAEQAAEERALLALQYHLERLAGLPVHAGLRGVLLNLVSAQKNALRRLVHAGKVEEMLAKRCSLRTHLKILVALLRSIRAVLSLDTVEANHSTTNGCRDRQQQGAAFQAQLSLVAFCYCFEKMNKVTASLSCWDYERIVQHSVQRAKDALTVTCQAAMMGARDAQSMAGAVVLMDEIFCRMEGYLHEQPSWAATLLPHVEDLLEHVAGCIAVPSMAFAMGASRLCLRLAEFLARVLRARLVLTGDHIQFSASVQRLQKLGCQLVRACTQAVDSLAGTDLLEGEKEVETTGSIRVRQWLAQGSDIRGAALHAAHSTWCQRWQDTLPSLTYVARAAHAAALQRELSVVAPSVSNGAGGPSSGGHGGVFALAVQRELSVSAILACANPLCPGQAAAFSMGTKLRLCAGCRGVRYCSDDCAKTDWTRHRPCCKALRLSSGATCSCHPGALSK